MEQGKIEILPGGRLRLRWINNPIALVIVGGGQVSIGRLTRDGRLEVRCYQPSEGLLQKLCAAVNVFYFREPHRWSLLALPSGWVCFSLAVAKMVGKPIEEILRQRCCVGATGQGVGDEHSERR